MAGNTKLAEIPADSAAAVAGVDEARAVENQRRVFDLEYRLIKTRDALTVIARGLEDFAQSDAVQAMGEQDAALIFGAVNLLESVAGDCDRAFRGEA